jgi:hypothetical protein
MSQQYNLTSDILIEPFGGESLVFLAEADCWVRLNVTATELLLSIREEAKARVSGEDLMRIIVGKYELDESDALDVASSLLEEWTKAGIVCPVPEENSKPCQNPSVLMQIR